ncbi:MAG: hypothetical protein EPO24_07855 [Bacteroidetes bacterium]|nr:MAG: hypothetical protein EPO24_07855 [Bacteroidota bacterium]
MTKRTVFILGAGASMPYGFPSGHKLVGDIVGVLKSKKSHFSSWGFLEKEIDNFRDAVVNSVTDAIDDLLIQRKEEFLEIGKLAIAHALTYYEIEHKLYDRNNPENWYGYLFEHLKGMSSMDLEGGTNSIITFNYDRSLEHYLSMASEGFYGLTDNVKKRAIQNIPIIHIHGSLGLLPIHSGHFPYEPTSDTEVIFGMSRNLKLIDEEADVSLLAKAHSLLQKAERIRFLGFGYHYTNLKKLEFTLNTKQCSDIKGTAYGLSEPDMDKIRTNYKINLDTNGKNILRFFREWDPL